MDDAHRPRIDQHRGEAKMGIDYFFFASATDPPHAKAVLNCLDFQSGAVFSAMVVKGGDPYVLAVALEAIKFTGRTRLIIMSDQENAVKNLVDMIRDSRTHETVLINSPKGSSASAGGIERANYEVEKQIRTLRSQFEENYGESVGLNHKMLPCLVRHCAWLITHYQVKSDGKNSCERLRLLKLYTSGTSGKLQTCPSWTTDGTQACGWERAWRQTSTMWGLQQEFAGVDPSGGAQRNNAGTGRC